MWLVVGLGNPGQQYSLTRHNIGFMAVDCFLHSFDGSKEKSEFKGLVSKCKLGTEEIITLKPQTFMNLSGESVQALMSFFKLTPQQLIVVHDEIDQPFAKMKIQQNRGHGGHNGVRSISTLLGSSDYIRVRLGVGRPSHPHFPVADYVLQNFSKEEEKELPHFLDQAVNVIKSIVTLGFEKTPRS